MCHSVDVDRVPISSRSEMANLLAIAYFSPESISSFKKEICPNCLERD